MSNVPTYVEHGGDLVLRPPFLHTGVRFDCFWLRARRERLHALVDRLFVRPSGGAVGVEPLSDGVALVVARIDRITSLDPVHAGLGGLSEIDVAFWIPVRVTVGAERGVRWVIPYLFVDNPYALATGRELYGFKKTLGRFELPERDASPRGYAVDAWGLDRPDPRGRVELRRLFAVERTDSNTPGVRGTLRESLRLACLAPLLGSRGHGANLVNERSTPILFLRQLRSAARPTEAAHQEILEAHVRVRGVPRVSLLPGDWRARMAPSVTHPIAEDLGFSAEEPVLGAFRAEFDCVAEAGRTLWSAQPNRAPGPRLLPPREKRRRIAILGGGVGAVTVALALTRTPELRARYEVTIHQQGFRLGGKGASGRNAGCHQRIEEHGLHVWFGSYENAFREIREVYAELDRPPGAPLATWREAFEPHHLVLLQERIDGELVPWKLEFPPNDLLPGDGGTLRDPGDWLASALRWTQTAIEMALVPQKPKRPGRRAIATNATLASGTALITLVDRALALLPPFSASEDAIAPLTTALRALRDGLRDRLLPRLPRVRESHERRRLLLTVELAVVCMLGALTDGVLTRGFDAIEDIDFVDWLACHGASLALRESAPVRAIYCLCFAFERGDLRRPNFAASAALQSITRLLFQYAGGVMWKMRAGMGDVVFAPIHEVLRRRGVRFEFFHRVESLRVSADGGHIAAIDIAKQATVTSGEYQPLVDVNGLPCFPSEPLLDQLVGGRSLGGVDFERGGSEPVERLTLEAGRDFDDVVLGISLGGLREVCSELVALHPRWRAMLDNVGTVGTIAAQLWLRPDLAGLGFSAAADGPPIQTAHHDGPLDTWADMTHTASAEAWPERPGHVAYLCGALDEREAGTPERAHAAADAALDTLLDTNVGSLWPNYDPAAVTSRYVRANAEGTERYVQSLAGSARHRLAAGDSGLANLTLAGDWTRTGLDVGCVEAAVISGLQCARALGAPVAIYGEAEPALVRATKRPRASTG
jgi:uncharacterized protein with NAD-binding domain and iron-sulfur cluster